MYFYESKKDSYLIHFFIDINYIIFFLIIFCRVYCVIFVIFLLFFHVESSFILLSNRAGKPIFGIEF